METVEESREGGFGIGGLPKGAEKLAISGRHLLRQRELFLSRHSETLQATHIRGKCTVTLLNEVETPENYLDREDLFFYSLVYDPVAVSLLADKGEIRVGDKYQCEVPDDVDPVSIKQDDDESEDSCGAEPCATERESLVYHPHHNLTDRDIDQFLIVARAVGTFSRALDTTSSVKLPSLHMTAAAASRDVTLLHAMALLHQANYDIGQAVKYLVPPPSKQHYPLDADKTTSHNTVSLGGPILCRDQMEEWSVAEANLFEEAIDKYGKDFNDIRADYLSWKSLRDIVEFYYMWKTTNRYAEIKKNKIVDVESKLKQVYIPNYNKPNPNLIGPPNPTGAIVKGATPCESCQIDASTHWYSWGPTLQQLRLCNDCWMLWKKYAGLKRFHEHELHDLQGLSSQETANGSQTLPKLTSQTSTPLQQATYKGASLPAAASRISSAQPQAASSQVSVSPTVAASKGRIAFYLSTTLKTKIARRLVPKSLLNIRRSARRPFLPINSTAIKQYCASRQTLEILQVARSMKGKKISENCLAQLAASMTASGSQVLPVSPTVTQKRNASVAGLPVIGTVEKQAKKQQFQGGQPKVVPIAQQQNVASSVALSMPSASALVKNLPPSIKTTSLHGQESKPIPVLPAIPLQPGAVASTMPISSIHPSMLAIPINTVPPQSVTSLHTDRKSLLKSKKILFDSKWNSIDERLLFLAGPRLKDYRRQVCARKIARRFALYPCREHEIIEKCRPGLQQFFS